MKKKKLLYGIEIEKFYDTNFIRNKSEKESHKQYFISFIESINARLEGTIELENSSIFIHKIILGEFEDLKTYCTKDSPRILLIPLFKIYYERYIKPIME